MEAGVPQGSVLGPLLWNITFNSVLEMSEDDEDPAISFVTQTTRLSSYLIKTYYTRLRASVFVSRVINQIEHIDLAVAIEKTNAIIFHSKGARMLPKDILIKDVLISFRSSIKYLGILLNVGRSFKVYKIC